MNELLDSKEELNQRCEEFRTLAEEMKAQLLTSRQ